MAIAPEVPNVPRDPRTREAIVIPPMPGEASVKLLDAERARVKAHSEMMERVRGKVVAIFVEENVTLKDFGTIITKILTDNNAVVDKLTVKEVIERYAS